MDLDIVSTFIGSIGFPIAAFCAMYWMCNTTLKEIEKAITDLRIIIEKGIVKDE